MAKKPRGPDYLEEFITEDKRHDFQLYAKAYKLYDLPYWTFVNLAKEAGATVSLRKTAVVDLIVLDRYIEEHTYDPEGARRPVDVGSARTGMKWRQDMSRSRKPIENMDELLSRGKKYIRSAEAREMYSVGRHTLEKWAKDAGALRKINGTVLINMEKLDAFIEANDVEEDD